MIDTYILWIVIIVAGFILLKKIAKIYIYDSNSNSIKTENSLMWQAYILLISGLLIIISIIFSDYMKIILQDIIFGVFCIFDIINILWFFNIILDKKQKYMKSQSAKMVISSHFLKNIFLLYFLYNYYILIIK